MNSNIYVIKNTANNKVYVGQSIDVEKRYAKHLSDSKSKENILYRAMRKYGNYNFYFEIVESNIPLSEIDEKEKYYIKKYNSKTPTGYNMTDGGEGTFGYTHTEENRKIFSIWSDEHRKNSQIAILNMTTERKAQQYIKAVNTKKQNGVDFAYHFKNMNKQEKNEMYEKISQSNPRRKQIIAKDLSTNQTIVFQSIGKAAKWLFDNGYTKSKDCKSVIRGCLNKTHICYNFEWNILEGQTTIESAAAM